MRFMYRQIYDYMSSSYGYSTPVKLKWTKNATLMLIPFSPSDPVESVEVGDTYTNAKDDIWQPLYNCNPYSFGRPKK